MKSCLMSGSIDMSVCAIYSVKMAFSSVDSIQHSFFLINSI